MLLIFLEEIGKKGNEKIIILHMPTVAITLTNKQATSSQLLNAVMRYLDLKQSLDADCYY